MDKLYDIFIEHLCSFKSLKAHSCYIFYGLYENTYILPIFGFGKTWGWVFFFGGGGGGELSLKRCISYWSSNSLFKTWCFFVFFYSTTYDLALIFQKLGFSITMSQWGLRYIFSYCNCILGYKQESYVIVSGWGLHSSSNISDMYSPQNEA